MFSGHEHYLLHVSHAISCGGDRCLVTHRRIIHAPVTRWLPRAAFELESSLQAQSRNPPPPLSYHCLFGIEGNTVPHCSKTMSYFLAGHFCWQTCHCTLHYGLMISCAEFLITLSFWIDWVHSYFLEILLLRSMWLTLFQQWAVTQHTYSGRRAHKFEYD